MGKRHSAGFLFLSRGKILVLRRSRHSRNAGTWGLPGGQRDAGESSWEAAQREASEEMGGVPLSEVLGQVVVDRPGKRYRIFVCHAGDKAHRRYMPSLNREHTEARWVSVAWCIRHLDDLHPVLAAMLESSRVARELERAARRGKMLRRHEARVARARVRSRAA